MGVTLIEIPQSNEINFVSSENSQESSKYNNIILYCQQFPN